MVDTYKEFRNLDSNHFPDDVQLAFKSLVDEISDAEWNLSPFSSGLRNFTGENFARIPQMVVNMFASSPSLIDALGCAFKLNFSDLISDNEIDSIVLKELNKSVFRNYKDTIISLSSFSSSLKRESYIDESELLAWFSSVLEALNAINIKFTYHALSKGAPPVMIPIHCELCHRFATESRFCNFHKHGTADRRKLELKFDNYYKHGRMFIPYEMGGLNTQLRRVSVWNEISLFYLSKMDVYPPITSLPIFSFDWLLGLPDTFELLSKSLSKPISGFGKILGDESEIWHQLAFGVTVKGVNSAVILISALFRHQLFCELDKFDRRSKNRKADPSMVLKLYNNGKGLKQAEIAREMNVSPPAISKIKKKHLATILPH